MKVIRKPGPGARILNEKLNLNGVRGKVGWFPSAKYPGTGIPVATIAAINEWGDRARGIPSRSYMRTTIAEKKNEWGSTARKYATRIIKGESTLNEAMEAQVLKASGDIRNKITKITSPPLSPVTILLRKWKKEGKTISGAKVGEAHREIHFVGPRRKKDKTLNLSGISTKPLVDTGYLLTTLTGIVEKK